MEAEAELRIRRQGEVVRVVLMTVARRRGGGRAQEKFITACCDELFIPPRIPRTVIFHLSLRIISVFIQVLERGDPENGPKSVPEMVPEMDSRMAGNDTKTFVSLMFSLIWHPRRGHTFGALPGHFPDPFFPQGCHFPHPQKTLCFISAFGQGVYGLRGQKVKILIESICLWQALP